MCDIYTIHNNQLAEIPSNNMNTSDTCDMYLNIRFDVNLIYKLQNLGNKLIILFICINFIFKLNFKNHGGATVLPASPLNPPLIVTITLEMKLY